MKKSNNFYRLVFGGLCLWGMWGCSEEVGQEPIFEPTAPIIIGEEQGMSSASDTLLTNAPLWSSSSAFFPNAPETPEEPEIPTIPEAPIIASSSSISSVPSSSAANFGLPPAGFYNHLTINPPVPSKGGVVKCTFDGSIPSDTLQPMTSALTLSQNQVVRCTEFLNGTALASTTQTYFINENVSMPVVAISVDPYEMFDEKDGLYSVGVNSGMGGGMGGMMGSFCPAPCYSANYWKDIELPVHVEFFEKGSSTAQKDWEIDAGLSISGQYSRSEAKKSVAIVMRSEYQDGRLKYALFKTRPDDKKFKAFNLRNNGNRFSVDYVEDAMLTSLLEGSGVDYQRSRQVVVFYNGSFHGIYDMRERLNRHFVETNYGIDSKLINMVKQKGDTVTASGDEGSTTDYMQLLNYIASNNFAGANNSAYENLKSLMDVNNFARYIATEIYAHNADWPNNNVRAWGAPPEHPFKFVVFDLDHGFGYQYAIAGCSNMFSWIKQGGGNNESCNGNGCFAQIYIKLIENPDFKRAFLNHSAIMLNYYLTYERVQTATREMVATIAQSEISRDMQLYPRGGSFDQNGNNLISYASTRTADVKREYQQEFGLDGNEITVNFSADGNGRVLLEGMHLPTMPYSGKFFNNTPMLITAESLGGMFMGWADGSTENPRLVYPNEGATYTAIFR